MALSNSELMSLMNYKNKQPKSNAWVMRDGKMVKELISPTLFGSFQGRPGTLKRTRKGNVSRNLNGSRKYVDPTFLQDGEVVAYLANR
jgi:hypothetical protein